MGQLMDLMQSTLTRHELAHPEGLQLTRLIADYARSWTLLQAYDEQTLPELDSKPDDPKSLGETEAIEAVSKLKANLMNLDEATTLCGQRRMLQKNSDVH